jgi:flagellar hook-associated protein 1 FlgK
MSLTQALNAATAGLQVTQQGLSVIAGNVANAQTPGYVRKTIDQLETAAGTSIGVRSGAIGRQLDKLIQTQLRTQTSGASFADQLSSLYQQLQDVYGTPGSSTGLDTLFNGFTSALQGVAGDPSSFSAQSTAINAAQVLAQQINAMSGGIQSLRGSAEQGISADVQAANNALQQVSTINQQVQSVGSADASSAALMDQRDKYIDQLSKLMDVRVVQATNNQVYVYTSSGTQLVGAGQNPAQLTFNAQGAVGANSLWNSDPTKSGVGTITLTMPGGGTTDLIATGAIQSGEIAAYLQMRDSILPQAQTQLDEFAAKMSQSLSDVTTAGTPAVAGPLTGFAVDTAGLQSGNQISLTYTDNASVQHKVSIVRVDDPSVLPLPQSTTADPNDQVVGVDFSGGMASVVAQLNTALGGAGLQFSNPAGTTLQVLNTPAATATVNALSATKTMTSLTSGNSQLPLFVDGTNVYSGAINATGPQVSGFAERISVNSALIADPSKLVTYSTSPLTASGDPTRPSFLYDQMANGASTFSPATGIGASTSPFNGTLTSFLGQVMSQQGQAADNANNLKQGQDVVVNALQQRMDSVSGVSIDQEMTNLLTLQNTYSANARVFSTIQQMFQTLLQM